MAYNFSCETNACPDWGALNEDMRRFSKLQYFPMAYAEEGKWGLGISIPMSSAGEETLGQFREAFELLHEKYSFLVYDLYYGCLVTTAHFSKLKKEIG